MRQNETPIPTGQRRALGAVIAVAAAATLGVLCARLAFADMYTEQPWGLNTPAERCVVCHSLEKGGPFRVAPNLWGIVGADKARDSDWYAYSPALIEMEGVWTPEELDRFLADANAFAPGSTKSIRVEDPEERQAIIDFLKELE